MRTALSLFFWLRTGIFLSSLPACSLELSARASAIASLRKARTNARSGGLSSGVLIVHVEGRQPRSTQVRGTVNPGAIRGFVGSGDGHSVSELRT